MNENQIAQENFNLPHDVLALPSKGIFYKNKKKSIKVGYLTAADENIIATVNKVNSGVMLTNLLRGKIYEPDIKIDELLEGDIQAVLIFLRNTAFGPEYNMTMIDPVTRKEFETTIKLDELNFKVTPNEPDSNGHFEAVLPMSNAKVKLRLLNYGESKELTKMEEEYPKGMIAPVITWTLMKQIVEIDGQSSKEEISKFINKMPIKDSKFIKKFLSENEPGIDMDKEIFTPSGERITASMSFGVEFFRPFF
jgi:hypothetical protein